MEILTEPAEAFLASKQSACTQAPVPPPPRRWPPGDQLNAAPVLATFPSQYYSCTLLASLAQKFVPWDQFLNRGSERLGQLPKDTQLLIRVGWVVGRVVKPEESHSLKAVIIYHLVSLKLTICQCWGMLAPIKRSFPAMNREGCQPHPYSPWPTGDGWHFP